MAPTILITVPSLADAGMKRLAQSGARTIFIGSDGGEAEIVSILASEAVDAVIVRTLSLSGDAIRSCPTLKVISRHGAGYNGVDVAAATALGIPVFIAPAANSQSVAELTIGLMLAVARTIAGHDASFRNGGWDRTRLGSQLGGQTLGLLGLGAIGRKVAEIAQTIGMTVVAFDQYLPPHLAPKGVTLAGSLDALLAVSDVLSIHCPLTPETTGLINAETIARMPRGAIVINTARGPIIDERALADALFDGHLSGAGLDTLSDEPPAANHAFRQIPNLVMTPHVGGNTAAALNSVAAIAVDNALDFLRGDTPDRRLCVNPIVLKEGY